MNSINKKRLISTHVTINNDKLPLITPQKIFQLINSYIYMCGLGEITLTSLPKKYIFALIRHKWN